MAEEEKAYLNVDRRSNGQWKPAQCTTPEECFDCYVTRIYNGDSKYCGNPRLLLKSKAMTEGKTKEMIKVESGKPFVQGDKLFIPKGSRLLCQSCSHTWNTTKARQPSAKTGIRCPKCHSRNIVNADGSAIPGMIKRQSRKLVMQGEAPSSQEQKIYTESRFKGKEPVIRAKRVKKAERGDAIDQLKRKLSPDREPTPETETPQRGMPPSAPPAPRGGVGMDDILTEDELNQIFDPETFQMLHEIEVEALCRKFKKPRYASYQKAIKSMSAKCALVLKIVFRHPDIDLALKIVLGLYVIQQMALIGAIATGSELGFKGDDSIAEEPKKDTEEEE